MTISSLCNRIFADAIREYFVTDDVDATCRNPHQEQTLEYFLFLKNWIDNAQWQLEDIIRNPSIDPVEAVAIKRRIDKSNQNRTDLVELIDSYFLDKYKDVKVLENATINSESPAWAIDRLSILKLKTYNMQLAVNRPDASSEQKAAWQEKLDVLLEQDKDLCTAIDQLIDDIAAGRKYMKVYKQMKMYNDPNLNPLLLGKSK